MWYEFQEQWHYIDRLLWAELVPARDIEPFDSRDWRSTRPQGDAVLVRKGSPLATWLALKGLIVNNL